MSISNTSWAPNPLLHPGTDRIVLGNKTYKIIFNLIKYLTYTFEYFDLLIVLSLTVLLFNWGRGGGDENILQDFFRLGKRFARLICPFPPQYFSSEPWDIG